jgi:hypothetical protein
MALGSGADMCPASMSRAMPAGPYGRLGDGPFAEVVGRHIDQGARNDLRQYYRSRGVTFGPNRYVTVNNRHYAGDGSFRIPDAAVGRISIDWTLAPKTNSTPQVQGFFNARRFPLGNPVGVVIVRPTRLGGSYFLAPPPTPPRG